MATATGLGGLSCDFVEEPPKALQCSVCTLIFREPYLTDCCGAHFCQTCVSPLKNNEKPCPKCHRVGFDAMIDRNKFREVSALMVYCANRHKGCEWQGAVCDQEKHGSACDYIMVLCALKCGEQVIRKDLASHEQDACPKRPPETKIKSLAKKLDEALSENLSLKEEVKMLKAQNKALKADNKEQARAIDAQQQRIVAQNAVELEKRKLLEMKAQLEKSKQEEAPPPMRTCPVCCTKFPARMRQSDFENHVQAHFKS